MTIDQKRLIELVNYGADIEFSYKGKAYTILAWVDGGISIGKQGSDDDKVYSSCDDFIRNCKIDGISIMDALPEMDVLYHS